MKCTMQKTEEEVEQLEYVLHEIEHIEKSKREPRVIPNAEISNVFASLCREFDYLQHRLKLFLNISWYVKLYLLVINSEAGHMFPDGNILAMPPC